MTTHAVINTVSQCALTCLHLCVFLLTNRGAPLHVYVYISSDAYICVSFLPTQVSSAMARRKLAACTRYWRCPTRGRTCPWWSFCLGRRYRWLPWSPSSKRRCWRSGPTMSNGRRWKSTCLGDRWHTWTHLKTPTHFMLVCKNTYTHQFPLMGGAGWWFNSTCSYAAIQYPSCFVCPIYINMPRLIMHQSVISYIT